MSDDVLAVVRTALGLPGDADGPTCARCIIAIDDYLAASDPAYKSWPFVARLRALLATDDGAAAAKRCATASAPA